MKSITQSKIRQIGKIRFKINFTIWRDFYFQCHQEKLTNMQFAILYEKFVQHL